MMMSGTDQSGEIDKHLNNSNLVTDILQEHISDNTRKLFLPQNIDLLYFYILSIIWGI